jgi:hypothetical protein
VVASQNIKTRLSRIYLLAALLILFLLSGCMENTKAPATQPAPTTAPSTTIEKISSELEMLSAAGWSELATQLGRPKTTAVLWYHLRTRFAVAPKIVFGKPNKLDTAIAILAENETSEIPTVSIKRVEYYVIDPTTPKIIDDFNYGDMFDDPGNNYLYDRFRLTKEDMEAIQQWMERTGVNIEYTEFTKK